MAYQGLNLGDIVAQASQIKGAQQRQALGDIALQQGQTQLANEQGIQSTLAQNPNASLADLSKYGTQGVQASQQLSAAQMADLTNQYRKTYQAASAVVNSDDPVGTVHQVAPEFAQQYDRVHGAGAFDKLAQDPAALKQQAQVVLEHAMAGLVDPDKQFQAHQEMIKAHFTQGEENRRAQMRIDAETKQGALNRAATAANDVKPVLNPDGSVTYVQANQAAGKNVGSTSGAIAGSITDQAKELAYQTFKTTGQMPAIGRGGAAVQAAYANYFAQRAAQDGDTGASIAAKGQAFKAQQGVLKDYTSGATSKALNGINTAVAHMDALDPLIDNLNNTSSPLFNKAANYFKQQTGSTAPTNFAALKDFVSGEVAKAVLPGGGGEAERQALSAPLAAANSPAQLKEAVQTIKTALAGKTEALRNQWDIGTNGTQGSFDKFLVPATRKALGIEGNASSVHGGTPGALVIPPNIQALLDKHQ